jgi:hypothetical protein
MFCAYSNISFFALRPFSAHLRLTSAVQAVEAFWKNDEIDVAVARSTLCSLLYEAFGALQVCGL